MEKIFHFDVNESFHEKGICQDEFRNAIDIPGSIVTKFCGWILVEKFLN
jgi:hypothetical protein